MRAKHKVTWQAERNCLETHMVTAKHDFVQKVSSGNLCTENVGFKRAIAWDACSVVC